MTTTSEDRVRLLEKEIKEKNELIATLQTLSIASMLLGGYFHETHNRITHLSLLLSNHFEICRKKGADEYISEITRTFEDLRDIQDTMSDVFLGRMRRSPRNNDSVEECIRTAVKVLEPHLRRSRIKLNTDLGKLSKDTRVSKKEFTTVLLNILMNAVDALQSIETGDRLINVEAISHGRTTYISITDNGNGIDKNMIETIWEPGFTTKGNRSGLGLTIAKSLVVESLGGQIEIKSKLGESTKVGIILQEKDYENASMD